MRVLVSGSAGHLGEALVRVLGDAGHDVVGLDLLASPYTQRRRLDRRPRVRPRGGGGRGRGGARGDAAQAPRRFARAGRFRGHQHRRDAEPARGGGGRRREPLPVHEHHERVRPRPDPGSRRARGLDHGGRRAGAAQHLRGHQDGRREPVRTRLARPRSPLPDPAHVAVLPRGRRPHRTPGRRSTISTSRSTNCCTGASICRTRPMPTSWRSSVPPRSASAATSSAPPRRSGPMTWPSCIVTRPAWCAGCTPITRRSTPAAAGRCSRSSTASTSTPTPATELGWSPAYDFRSALDRLAAGEDPRSPLALEIGAKGYHAEPTGVYTTRTRDPR